MHSAAPLPWKEEEILAPEIQDLCCQIPVYVPGSHEHGIAGRGGIESDLDRGNVARHPDGEGDSVGDDGKRGQDGEKH
jgi:hypothetical protein